MYISNLHLFAKIGDCSTNTLIRMQGCSKNGRLADMAVILLGICLHIW